MNLILSIKARIDSVKNTLKSRYWDYTKYYKDGEIWEDTVFLESFNGKNFQGNPYYIYKHLIKDEKYKDYKIVVSSVCPEKLKGELTARGLIRENVSFIESNSAEYKRVIAHAKYLVSNVSFPMDFIKKKEQVYLNTWHGTPLKTLGRRVLTDPFMFANAQRNFLMSDYLIAPNPLTKSVYEDDHCVKGIMQGELCLAGYPRNSVFFNEEYRSEVKKRYGLENAKTILYMPTWRGDACKVDKVDQVSEIERLAKDLGEEYRVYVKFHPAMQNQNGEFKYCKKMPDGIEVYEFLNAVDILITDYSSVFFDYANAGKKIVLYQYDKAEYYESRGVYPEVEKNLPFPIAYTYDELLDFVKNEKAYDDSEFLKEFCPYDNLFGAKTAVEKLFSGKPNEKQSAVDLYVVDFPVTEEQVFAWQEKLKNTNFLFAFVLGKNSGEFEKIKAWDKIRYTALNVYDRLTFGERIKKAFYQFFYCVFKSKGALKKLKEYAARERTRIFGYTKIGHIYAKGNKLPTSVQIDAEAWPTNL